MNVTSYPDFELKIGIIPLCCYILAHTIIFVLTVLGNFAVILTNLSKRLARTPNTIFVSSLAIADMLTGIFALPATLYARVVISPLTCLARTRTLFFTPAFLFWAVSVFHLVIFTIDRFMSISFPLKHPGMMTIGRCKVILLVTWTIGVTLGVFSALASLKYDPSQWVCGTVNYDAGIITVILAGFTPVAVSILLLFYIGMSILAKRHLEKESAERQLGMDTDEDQQLQYQTRVKVTVTAMLVVLMFGVCWIPTSVKAVVELYLQPSEKTQFFFVTLTEYVGFSNSFVNPIIYALRHNQYKNTYRNLCRKICPCFIRKHLADQDSETNEVPKVMMRSISRQLSIPPSALIRSSS